MDRRASPSDRNLSQVFRIAFSSSVSARLGAAVGLAVVATAVTVAAVVLLARDERRSSTTLLDPRQAEHTLRDYLAALSDGDYRTAAVLLVGGDESLGERTDLAPLQLDELSVESLADALAAYCRDGCVEPTSVVMTRTDGDGGYRAMVDFGEPRGHVVQRPFVVWATPDGEAYVRGLPPPDMSPIPPSS